MQLVDAHTMRLLLSSRINEFRTVQPGIPISEYLVQGLVEAGVPFAAHRSLVRLSPRTAQALEKCAQGRSYRETGDDLGMAASTVAAHLKEARKLLGARNTTHAVVLAIKLGLLDIGAPADALPSAA